MSDESRVGVSTQAHGSFLDLRFTDFLWMVLFSMLLFTRCLGTLFGFTYGDELATAVLAASAVVKVSRDWARRELVVPVWGVIACFSMATLLVLGLLGNYVWEIQPYDRAVLTDVLACFKFPVALIASVVVFSRPHERMVKYLEVEAKAVTSVLLLCAIANVFVDFGMGGGYVYGLREFEFLCGHPTGVVAMGVNIMLVLMVRKEENRLWIVADALVIASSLTSKGLVFCALAVTVMLLMRGDRRFTVWEGAICLCLAVVIGWDQFVAYFMTEGYARTELTRASIEVAFDYFPLGAGFATFGSNVTASAPYYSSLYYEYGLSDVWGLTPDGATFLSDTFWPIILGQFGLFGLLVFLLLLFALFKICYERAGRSAASVVCCFAYLLISSTSESALFNPLAIGFALTLGIVLDVPSKERPRPATGSLKGAETP